MKSAQKWRATRSGRTPIIAGGGRGPQASLTSRACAIRKDHQSSSSADLSRMETRHARINGSMTQSDMEFPARARRSDSPTASTMSPWHRPCNRRHPAPESRRPCSMSHRPALQDFVKQGQSRFDRPHQSVEASQSKILSQLCGSMFSDRNSPTSAQRFLEARLRA